MVADDMDITILTLFPGMFAGSLDESILKRAAERGIVRFCVRNIRDYAAGQHKTVDDSPYGGGPGMLMKPEPLALAINAARAAAGLQGTWVTLLTPQGQVFDQALAQRLARRPGLTLVCGRYEGVDERVRQHLVDEEISIGDFILTGGEPAAVAIIDAVVRLLPGALGDVGSNMDDSFARGLLEYPQYTRPAVFRDWRVPDVLLSGDHQAIAQWRRRQAILRTHRRRPDLLAKAGVSQEELQAALREEQERSS